MRLLQTLGSQFALDAPSEPFCPLLSCDYNRPVSGHDGDEDVERVLQASWRNCLLELQCAEKHCDIG